MALIKCPECGKEKVSDTAEACPDCGYGIRVYFDKIKLEELQREKNERERKELERKTKEIEAAKMETKMKRQEFLGKYKYSLVIGLVAIIILFVLFGATLYLKSDSKKYQDAQKLFDNESYLEAKDIFLNIKDKRTVEDEINNCNYNIAKQLIAQGQYSDAIDMLGVVYGYTDTLELINEAKYGIAMDFFASGNTKDAFEILYGFKDSENYSEDIMMCIEQDNKAVFDFAEELYEDAQFENALEIFNMLNKSESSEELKNYIWYCKEYIKIQGYWYNERDKNKYVVVDGNTITIHGSIISEATMKEYNNHIIGDGSYSIKPTILVNKTTNELYLKFEIDNASKDVTIRPPIGSDSLGFVRKYQKGEQDIILISVYLKDDAQSPYWRVEPQIGMTADEVRSSTWGNPKKKDTYSWGVKEQWVYSGYRYIYLEDGIVTSISE